MYVPTWAGFCWCSHNEVVQSLVKTLLQVSAVGNPQLFPPSFCPVVLEQAAVGFFPMSMRGSRPSFGVQDPCEIWECCGSLSFTGLPPLLSGIIQMPSSVRAGKQDGWASFLLGHNAVPAITASLCQVCFQLTLDIFLGRSAAPGIPSPFSLAVPFRGMPRYEGHLYLQDPFSSCKTKLAELTPWTGRVVCPCVRESPVWHSYCGRIRSPGLQAGWKNLEELGKCWRRTGAAAFQARTWFAWGIAVSKDETSERSLVILLSNSSTSMTPRRPADGSLASRGCWAPGCLLHWPDFKNQTISCFA